MRPVGAVAGAALICVLGACASSGAPSHDRPGLHLSSWAPPSGQHCGLLDDLPAFGAVFDSAVVVHAMEAFGELRGAGAAVLDVGIIDPDAGNDSDADAEERGPLDPEGREVRVRVAESTLSPADEARLEQILVRGVLPDAAGHALLRVDFSPLSFQWANTLFCRPTAVNRKEFEEALLLEATRSDRRGEVVLHMFVGTDGSVLSVEVHKGSGFSEVDRAAVVAAGTLRFAPALHNRVPAPAFVQLPVRTWTSPPQRPRRTP